MISYTLRFGPIEYRHEDAIRFPRGLIGFPLATRYMLISHDDEWPFSWLQSLDDSALAFVVAPLEVLFPEYAEQARHNHPLQQAGGVADNSSLLGLVVLDADPTNLTINLLAPLLVDFDAMSGEQIILEGPLELARQRLEAALQALATA